MFFSQMFRLLLLFTLHSVTGAETDGMKDCTDNGKTHYKCLFMTKTERTADPSCCYPVHNGFTPLMFTWNKLMGVENGVITSFMNLNNPCKNPISWQEKGPMSCLPREGISDMELSPYPIHHSQFSTYTAEQADPYYCSDDFTSVYDVVLTCWLYDCEPRLKIPQTAKEMGQKEKKAKNLCLPPILHKENPKKYCNLYATDIKETKLCEWPPICGKEGKIDESEYLIPLVDGKPAPEYCEVLCPSNSNTGKNDEKPCRQVPICPANQTTNELIGADFNNTKTNPYKMHFCYPFCTEEESQFLDPNRRKDKKECQPLPPCKNETHPDAPFTESNPFGALSCIDIPYCEEGQDPKAVNCNPAKQPLSDNPGDNAPPSMAGIIVVCVLVPCVVIGIVGAAVFLAVRRRKANSRKNAAKTNVVMMKTMADSTPSGRGSGPAGDLSTDRTKGAAPSLETLSDRLRDEAAKKGKRTLEGSGRDISFKSARIIAKKSVPTEEKQGNNSKSESSLLKRKK